jgi:hypothetical protein
MDGIVNNIISPGVQKEVDALIKSLDAVIAKMEQIGISAAKVGIDMKGAKSLKEVVDLQKELEKAEKEAQKTAEKINAEREKGYKLIEKQQQKEKESLAKKDAKDQEDAMKRLNAESEKRVRALQKEADYLKKYGEETTKLTRQVEALRVKTQELILTKGKENSITQASQKEYDAARKKLTDLQQTMGNHTQDVGRYGKVWDTLKSSWMAVSGVLAGLAGTFKVMKDAIVSSDALTDAWEETIGAAKEGYSAFLRTIATGDWSNFFTNIRNAAEAGREYARVLDEIHERTLGLSIVEAEVKMRINDLILQAKDQRLSDTERGKAAADALKLETDLLQKKSNLAWTAFRNELNIASAQTGLNQATIAQFLKLRDYNNEKIKAAELYLKAVEDLREMQASGAKGEDFQKEIDKTREKINQTSASIRVYATEVVEKIGKLSPETMDKVASSYAQLYTTQNDFKEGTRRLWSQYTGFVKKANDAVLNSEKDTASEAKKLTDEKVKQETGATKLKLENSKKSISELWGITLAQIKQEDGFKLLNETEQNQLILDRRKKFLDDQLKDTISAIKLMQDELKAMTGGTGAITIPVIVAQMTPTGTAPKTMNKVDNPAVSSEIPKTDAEIAVEKDREAWSKRLEITRDFVSQINELVNTLYQNEFDKIDEQLAANSEAKEQELALAGDNSRKKEQIEAKYRAKEKELEKDRKKAAHDQAVYNKLIAATQIIINTAIGAMKSYAELGPIGGTVGAVLVIAMGAIELAAVLAQNIPSYSKGRKGGPAEFAKVHPGELIKYPSGDVVRTPNIETTTFLPKGADVIPANKVIEMGGRFATPSMKKERDGIVINLNDKYGKEMLTEMKKKKPETRIYQEGKYTVYETGNYRLKTAS